MKIKNLTVRECLDRIVLKDGDSVSVNVNLDEPAYNSPHYYVREWSPIWESDSKTPFPEKFLDEEVVDFYSCGSKCIVWLLYHDGMDFGVEDIYHG